MNSERMRGIRKRIFSGVLTVSLLCSQMEMMSFATLSGNSIRESEKQVVPIEDEQVNDGAEYVREEPVEEEIPAYIAGDYSQSWTTEEATEGLSADSLYRVGSIDSQTTDTKKVPIDDSVAIATASAYKDMDYSFLKEFSFGETYASDSLRPFDSVEDMKACTHTKMKPGAIVRTSGYYEAGDGGAASYKLVQANEKVDWALELDNGLYAVFLPDKYTDKSGRQWYVASVKQFGAHGDGETADNGFINNAFSFMDQITDKDADIERSIVYIPKGEYKCTNQIHVSGKKINIVGEGENSILFTDNDYRKEEGYAEHFFQVWGAENAFFGNFVIEAREVDLHHYMRQFTLIYCTNIYIYNVDLLIPQTTYNSYYFEDKQYSNFCCYSGNTDITVDGCKMTQMSGTYRGANVGVLDIWSTKEKNITIMNCDLYGNARDEQIGFFSTENDSAGLENISFLNNTIHSSQLKYIDITGHRTMCMTVAYDNSKNISGIRIAGNHFICEADSNFATFGSVKNCVIEDNIIEVIASHGGMGDVFHKGNTVGDYKDILIQNNEIFITSVDGSQRKSNVATGHVTFSNNKLVADSAINFFIATKNAIANNNEIVLLRSIGSVANSTYQFNGNQISMYAGAADHFYLLESGQENKDLEVNGNTVYDYKRDIWNRYQNPWHAVNKIYGGANSLTFSNNTYYKQNAKRTDTGEAGEELYDRIFYWRGGELNTITYENNTLQGVGEEIVFYGVNTEQTQINKSNNTTLPYQVKEEELPVTAVDITYAGSREKITEITSTGDTVSLDKIVRVATEMDEENNVLSEAETEEKEIHWYTSVDGIASVDSKGNVTRKLYGDVKVFAVAADGSGVYGECIIHFVRKTATNIQIDATEIDLQPGLKFYADYVVLPENEANQTLSWESSDTEIATVSKIGTITAVNTGDAVITGRTVDGSDLQVKITVHVTPVTVKKINISSLTGEPYLYFTNDKIGTTSQLKVTSFVPDNATNKQIGKWESTNTKVATVDQNGVVTVTGSGVGEIRAYSTDEKCYGKCSIYVQPPKVTNLAATDVTDRGLTLSWKGQDTGYGYYVYQWDDSSNEWKTLGGSYTTSDSYKVSGLSAGTTYKFKVCEFITNWDTETRILYEGPENMIKATTMSYQPVQSFSCNAQAISIIEGAEKRDLRVTYSPNWANYENLEITWQVADESMVEVLEMRQENNIFNFTLKGLKAGVTSITFSSNDSWNKSITIPIGVVSTGGIPADSFELSAEYQKIDVRFHGREEDSAFDGYMLSRVIGYRYEDVQYFPKNDTGEYSCSLEGGFIDGDTYTYTVMPCVKSEDIIFYGLYTSPKSVTMPVEQPIESIKLSQEQYVVPFGETVEVKAVIAPEDASIPKLDYSFSKNGFATIENIIKENSGAGTDYASLTGKAGGVTYLRAEARDSSDCIDTAKVIVLHGPVKQVQYATTPTQIDLIWEKCENAGGYYVYRLNESTNTYERVAEVEENEYLDTNIVEDTTYFYKISAWLEEEGTRYEGAQTEPVEICAAENIFQIDARGYKGTYDGKEHKAVTVTGQNPKTDSISYSVDGKTWSQTVPTVKNVTDSKIIYIRVTRKSVQASYEISVVAKVDPSDLDKSKISLSKTVFDWNGKVQKPTVQISGLKEGENFTVAYPTQSKKTGNYNVIVTGTGNYKGSYTLQYSIKTYKGHTYTVSGYKYKITGAKTVTVKGSTNKKRASVTIKNTVNLGGKIYKVTSVAANAFKGYKKLKKVTIGKNVTTIGKNAFYGDKKLSKITIKSKIIKSIGKNSFGKINEKANIYMPKKQKNKYRKLLGKKTGYKNTMRIIGK
ncbi:MAG: leucine-rich repeat protein [Lachnospiraceae bacterium]|nr:leucine-rich repeat protein [Lachnospiraceae bacterium]